MEQIDEKFEAIMDKLDKIEGISGDLERMKADLKFIRDSKINIWVLPLMTFVLMSAAMVILNLFGFMEWIQ